MKEYRASVLLKPLKCIQIERKLQDNGSFVHRIFEDLQFADNVRKKIFFEVKWPSEAATHSAAQCVNSVFA